MAEQRATRTTRTAPQRGASRAAAAEKQFEIDELFDEIESTARTWLQNFANWVSQGDELLTKGRAWLEEHPVALGVAKKYGRKLTFMPTSLDEAIESARTAGSRLKGSARRGFDSAKAHPLDTALVAGALGLAAFVLARQR